jgi:ferric-dicitrate binding protein FerR (iron transport regulator)
MIAKCIADYCRRTLSRRDFARLGDWLAADPANREELIGSLRTYRRARMATLDGLSDSDRAWDDIVARLRRRRRRPLTIADAAAAAVILLACIPIFLRDGGRTVEPGTAVAVLQLADGREIALDDAAKMPSEEVVFTPSDGPGTIAYRETEAEAVFHSVRVPTGGEYSVVLADGTRVRLNSQTNLRYPTRFTGDRREVWVEGEVYLDVAPDPSRPFVVRTADATIEVLGTSFNVAAYHGQGSTVATLVSGRVAVEAGGERVEIEAGQQATASGGGIAVSEADVESCVSWTRGTFEFENMPLGEICTRLSRWYGVEFEFADQRLAGRRFTGGTWKYVPLDDLLKSVEKATDISFRSHGDRVVVSSRKR